MGRALCLAIVTLAVACKQLGGTTTATVKTDGPGNAVYGAVVMLTLLDSSQAPIGVCSGIFVREGQVLTVAHCFDGGNARLVQVSAYAGNLHNNAPVTSQVVLNPNDDHTQAWATRMSKDLALIKVPANAAGPMQLPVIATKAPTFPAAGSVVGYGETVPGDVSTAGVHYIKAVTISGMDASTGNAFTTPVWPAVAAAAAPSGAPVTVPPPGLGQGGDIGVPLFNADHELLGLGVGIVNPLTSDPPNSAPASAGAAVHYVSLLSNDANAFLSKNLAASSAAQGTSSAPAPQAPAAPASPPASSGGDGGSVSLKDDAAVP